MDELKAAIRAKARSGELTKFDDVVSYLKGLHSELINEMLESEMDFHLGYEKHSNDGDNSGNSRNGSFPKRIKSDLGESEISVPRDRKGDFEPKIIEKHKKNTSGIERLVISLYAKGMSVSDIEEELREIYGFNLSQSAISVITNRVMQNALEWQNRPLDSYYFVVWMDGIVLR